MRKEMAMITNCEATPEVRVNANFSLKLLSDLEGTVSAFLRRLEGIGQIEVTVTSTTVNESKYYTTNVLICLKFIELCNNFWFCPSNRH